MCIFQFYFLCLLQRDVKDIELLVWQGLNCWIYKEYKLKGNALLLHADHMEFVLCLLLFVLLLFKWFLIWNVWNWKLGFLPTQNFVSTNPVFCFSFFQTKGVTHVWVVWDISELKNKKKNPSDHFKNWLLFIKKYKI